MQRFWEELTEEQCYALASHKTSELNLTENARSCLQAVHCWTLDTLVFVLGEDQLQAWDMERGEITRAFGKWLLQKRYIKSYTPQTEEIIDAPKAQTVSEAARPAEKLIFDEKVGTEKGAGEQPMGKSMPPVLRIRKTAGVRQSSAALRSVRRPYSVLVPSDENVQTRETSLASAEKVGDYDAKISGTSDDLTVAPKDTAVAPHEEAPVAKVAPVEVKNDPAGPTHSIEEKGNESAPAIVLALSEETPVGIKAPISDDKKSEHVKIESIVPDEYSDFLSYCREAGKVFAEELDAADYIAYRAQFGRTKKEGKEIRAIIEAGVLLKRPEEDDAVGTAETAQEQETNKDSEMTSAPAENAGPIIEEAAETELIPLEDQFGSARAADPMEGQEKTYAEIWGLNADDYADMEIKEDLYGDGTVILPVRVAHPLYWSGYHTLRDVLLELPSKLPQAKYFGVKASAMLDETLWKISKRGSIIVSDEGSMDKTADAKKSVSVGIEKKSEVSSASDRTADDKREEVPCMAEVDKVIEPVREKNYAVILGVAAEDYADMPIAGKFVAQNFGKNRRGETYAERFGLIVNDYMSVQIKELQADLGKRAFGALMRSSYKTIGALLLLTPMELSYVKGMGPKAVQTVEAVLKKIADEEAKRNQPKEDKNKLPTKEELIKSARATIEQWDPKCLSKRLSPFVQLYNAVTPKHKLNVSVAQEAKVSQYEAVVEEILQSEDADLNSLAEKLGNFQRWMAGVDLAKKCRESFSLKNKKDNDKKGPSRSLEMLYARVAGRSLEEIGQEQGVTRERVRQIVKNALINIHARAETAEHPLSGLIFAYRNGEHILYEEDILKTIGEKYGKVFWYGIVPNSKGDSVYPLKETIARYDPTCEAMIVLEKEGMDTKTSGELLAQSREAVESIPDLLETEKLQRKLRYISNTQALPLKLLRSAADEVYREEGICSYKGRLTVVRKCDYVLKHRFQNGYKIQDPTDGQRFRDCLAEFFGGAEQMTIRAVEAILQKNAVLIARGKYIHPDYIHIDKRLIRKVFAYIENSPKDVIPYVEILAALADAFQGTPITNRYILQGVIKLYGCPYPTNRDNVIKKKGANIADAFETFMRARKRVHKSEIFEHFPGWKDPNINFVLMRCPDVITLGNGYYMHASCLRITVDEREKIKKYLDTVLGDIPVSARYLLNDFESRFATFMLDHSIQDHDELFGILQYIFAKDYTFRRPFIARANMGKMTNKMVILKHLEGMDEIEIDDLCDICEQNEISYLSKADLIETLMPEFLRADERTLCRAECIGLSEDMYPEIAEQIQSAVQAHRGYIAAGHIEDFSWYPTLDVPWTPFLLESIASQIPKIRAVKIQTSVSDITRSIFVGDEYAEDDWESLLVKILKKEHEAEPFYSQAAVHQWLQEEGLCNVKYPHFLERDHHVYTDEDGMLRVE